MTLPQAARRPNQQLAEVHFPAIRRPGRLARFVEEVAVDVALTPLEFARRTPHTVRFLPELPKTATGKIQKFVLRGGRAAIARQ